MFSAIAGRKTSDLLHLVYTALVFYAGYRLLASQYPAHDAFFGINYTRIREMLPVLQVVIPFVTLGCIFACGLGAKLKHPVTVDWAILVVLAIATAGSVRLAYDRDAYEVLAYDDLIRHERYADVIARAEKYQPHNPVSACSVNFCLFMNGQLEQRLTQFYQCGTEGLVLPSIRDNLSDIHRPKSCG